MKAEKLDLRLGDHSGEQCLVCPICGYEYTHIDRIESFDERNDADYRYDGDGGMRGGGLRLAMWGECDHKWTLCLQHHKGITYTYTIDRSDNATGDAS